MPTNVLTAGALTEDEVDEAMRTLPPLPDNVLVIVRHLQAQVTTLTARVATLEAP